MQVKAGPPASLRIGALRAALPAAALGAFAGGLFLLETGRPLRDPGSPKLPRALRNLGISLASSPLLLAVENPLAGGAARSAARGRRGALGSLPPLLRIPLAVLLMDYTLHLWHILLHRVPFLWRFHGVHHLDRDLDVTTALRFHFGELLLSVPWRLAQVRLIGTDPESLKWWRRFLGFSVLFHHSNLRLPAAWDAGLARVLATPRLHGIHHSRKRDESLSNFSSGFTLWDRLHGTYRDGVPQGDIRIGAPGIRCAGKGGLREQLAWPFRRGSEVRAGGTGRS